MKAEFQVNPADSRTFLAKVYTEVDYDTLQKFLLPPSTSLLLALQDGTTLHGFVVEKDDRDNANFSAWVSSSTPVVFGDTPYPVTVKVKDDSTTFKRQMLAVQALESGHGERKPGVYLNHLLLNEPIPPDHSSNKVVEPAKVQAFKHHIARWNLNAEQEAAAMDTLANEKDVVIIDSHPGTGKTTALIAAIEAHVKLGKQVLVCAPTNAAVKDLVKQWIEHADDTRGQQGWWTIFRGAYLKKPFRSTAVDNPEDGKDDVDDTAAAYWSQLSAQLEAKSGGDLYKYGLA
jgi:hypothetical protein